MVNWGTFSVFFSTGVPSEILVSSLFIMVVVVAFGFFCKRVKNKRRYVLWVLLAEYLFIVSCSTVICRGEMSFDFDRLQLMPFWTYKAVVNHVPCVSVWDIVLNIVLFIPLGFLLKLLYPSITALNMLLVALVCSLCIEVNQYVFEKGIAQIDDVMHNAIGAMLGWLLASVCIGLINKCNSRL